MVLRVANPNTLTIDGRDLAGEWIDAAGGEWFVAVVWQRYVVICYRQHNTTEPWPILVMDDDFGEGRRFQRP